MDSLPLLYRGIEMAIGFQDENGVLPDLRVDRVICDISIAEWPGSRVAVLKQIYRGGLYYFLKLYKDKMNLMDPTPAAELPRFVDIPNADPNMPDSPFGDAPFATLRVEPNISLYRNMLERLQ